MEEVIINDKLGKNLIEVNYICVSKDGSQLNVFSPSESMNVNKMSKFAQMNFQFPIVLNGGKQKIDKLLVRKLAFNKNKSLYFPINTKLSKNAYGVYVENVNELKDALLCFENKSKREFTIEL